MLTDQCYRCFLRTLNKEPEKIPFDLHGGILGRLDAAFEVGRLALAALDVVEVSDEDGRFEGVFLFGHLVDALLLQRLDLGQRLGPQRLAHQPVVCLHADRARRHSLAQFVHRLFTLKTYVKNRV